MLLNMKQQFVAGLSETIIKYQENVESITYDVFEKIDDPEWHQEFLVINYVEGARTIRPCNGNSYSAIFEEISRYLDHGRYDNEDYYSEFADDPDWKLI